MLFLLSLSCKHLLSLLLLTLPDLLLPFVLSQQVLFPLPKLLVFLSFVQFLNIRFVQTLFSDVLNPQLLLSLRIIDSSLDFAVVIGKLLLDLLVLEGASKHSPCSIRKEVALRFAVLTPCVWRVSDKRFALDSACLVELRYR
jgi:hypothetical protein